LDRTHISSRSSLCLEIYVPKLIHVTHTVYWMDWIVQCFTSPPTQYRLYGRRFLQVKRPNQQYRSTEGTGLPGLNGGGAAAAVPPYTGWLQNVN